MKNLLFVLVVAVISLTSSSTATIHTRACTVEPSDLTMLSEHCNGTVWCNCRGGVPKANGDE